jgi:hypothetical protein
MLMIVGGRIEDPKFEDLCNWGQAADLEALKDCLAKKIVIGRGYLIDYNFNSYGLLMV